MLSFAHAPGEIVPRREPRSSALAVAALAALAFAVPFNRLSAQAARAAAAASGVTASDAAVYETYFRSTAMIVRKGGELEKAGAKNAMRAAACQGYGLGEHDCSITLAVAESLYATLLDLDRRAREVIDEAHARKLATGHLPPLPEELNALQAQRTNAVIDAMRVMDARMTPSGSKSLRSGLMSRSAAAIRVPNGATDPKEGDRR